MVCSLRDNFRHIAESELPGGNMELDSEGNRQASGAMHNFGVRIDLLDGIGEPVALDDFIKKP